MPDRSDLLLMHHPPPSGSLPAYKQFEGQSASQIKVIHFADLYQREVMGPHTVMRMEQLVMALGTDCPSEWAPARG